MSAWFWDHWRTLLDIATAVATILAAGLAWRAIVQTKRESIKAANALVRERRIDFELDLLDRLSVAYETGWDADAVSAPARSALDLLPPGEFEWCRGYVRADGPRAVEVARSKPAADLIHVLASLRSDGGEPILELMRAEVRDAVARRLDERAPIVTAPPQQ
jgi:hypothetical protein